MLTRPCRVLHLVDSLKLGGVQTLLCDVLPGLAEQGVDVRVAALHGPGPFSDVLAARGITPLHLATSRFDPRLMWRLAQLLKSGPVDVLHTHGVPSCWLGQRALASGRVPHLIQHLHHMYQGQHGQPLQNGLERLVYRRGTRLVACSQAVADSVGTPLPKEIIYNGIDTELFAPPNASERMAARAHFGFGPEDQVFCMTGRITRLKGVHTVCEAVAALHAEFPALRLLLVGHGPDEAAVRAYSAEAGISHIVRMPGFVEDVLLGLHAADHYVMASTREGLGSALLEAMATALPVIVADYPAAAEIVEDGVNARVVVGGTADGFQQAIREALVGSGTNPAQGEAARRVVEARFSLPAIVTQWKALYEDVVA